MEFYAGCLLRSVHLNFILVVRSTYTNCWFLSPRTLQSQTVHWIGAQFCGCMFLDCRDKSLNMPNFVRTIKEIESIEEEQKERPCYGIRLQFTKYTA